MANSKKTIVLIEDDAEDIDFVTDALAKHNFNGDLITLRNGQAFLDKFNQQRMPDRSIIVLDLNMPLKDGFEVLQYVRSNPDFKDVPVVVLSSSTRKKDQEICLELGCNQFLQKPNSIEDYFLIAKNVIAVLNGLRGNRLTTA